MRAIKIHIDGVLALLFGENMLELSSTLKKSLLIPWTAFFGWKCMSLITIRVARRESIFLFIYRQNRFGERANYVAAYVCKSSLSQLSVSEVSTFDH